MPSRETLLQPDGSRWQYYHIADGAAVITSRGQELIHSNPGVLRSIHDYRRKCLGRSPTGGSPDARVWFQHGGNSDVYELAEGSQLVVKENTTSQAMYYGLQRMDRLKTVIDKGVPRWIDIPEHYGILCSSSAPADYMLMQKIDAGITVADIVESTPEEQDENPAIADLFGPIDGGVRLEVSRLFTIAKTLLDEALKKEGLDPKDFLPDWDSGNVLVERLETPIADSNYMLWVIDQ